MHDGGKSDRLVLPAKLPNNPASAGAEVVEGRGLPEGNTAGETRPGRSAGLGVSSDLDRVRQVARKDGDVRFTALLHHVDVDRLREAYLAISPNAAPGVDGVTWRDYGLDLEANLQDLHARVHRGAYRARPSRRVFIPKPDGRLRPLGVAALEDKILQRAVVEVLNAIYENDFVGFSYGFRPGRSQHDALDALAVAIERKKVNWVLDADLRDYFTSLDQSWLLKFLEHRIADQRVLRLIQKWLAAGVIEDGEWSLTETGTAQGASVSPLLSNVYLHYVFDLWADQWRRRHARGDVILCRFADDYVPAEDLADIAIQSAASARAFGIEPRVAMISFSTGASGVGSDVDKVAEATRIVREREPELAVDGPLQYDAAAIASVGLSKRPGSPVAGRANVFIFPDLDTGNTTYKAVQRTAHVVSVGPMLQGLAKPVNDLSRGALVDDIVYTLALTAIQSRAG